MENKNIQPANKPTQEGQGQNPIENIQDIVGQALSEPTNEQQHKEELRETLRQARLFTYTEVPETQYALEVDGKGIFALRDIHAVKAKQKAGKTTSLKVMIAALLKGEMFRVKACLKEPRIVFFDTEQSRTDTKLILQDVQRMSGLDNQVIDSRLALYSMRRCNFEELLDLLRTAVEDEQPQVVFIDGIVEFVASFNDEAMAKQLIHDLLVLCEENNCAIVNVLHTNKADEDHNMRGHLGTMLAQKAATVLECHKRNGVITVSCSDARHQEMPDWSIRFNDDGQIVDADAERQQAIDQRRADLLQQRQERFAEKQKERLDKCIEIIRRKGGAIRQKELAEELMDEFNVKRSTSFVWISQWLKDRLLKKVDGLIHDSNELCLEF